MNHTLFLISGKVGVGKDTTADIIEEKNKAFRHANGDPLKNITIDLINYFQSSGIDLETLNKLKDIEDHYIIKDDNMRDVLYRISKILKKEFYDDVWIDLFFKKWRQSNCNFGIIPDIRRDELIHVRRICPSYIKIIHFHIMGESRREYKNIGHGMNDVVLDDQTITIHNSGTIDDLRENLRPYL